MAVSDISGEMLDDRRTSLLHNAGITLTGTRCDARVSGPLEGAAGASSSSAYANWWLSRL